MRPGRPIAALVLVLGALAAGCGGDAEEERAYVAEVEAAQRAFVTRFDGVRDRLEATSTLAQDRATLGEFGTATEAFVAALAGIGPPAAVREEHGRLVAAVGVYRREVERAGRRLRGGAVQDRARVRTELSSRVAATQARIAEAVEDINAGLRG